MHSNDEKYFKEILSGLSEKDRDFLIYAYDFSKKVHLGQKRKSGDDYFIHPLSVSISLWNKTRDIDLVVAGLLHDTVEDCQGVEISTIYEKFGKNIGFMVDAVTKGDNYFYNEKDSIDNSKDKVLAGGMRNIGCILLKLADREHNLSTLDYMPVDSQIKKSFESQSLYLPLMHILGYNNNKVLDIEECDKLFKDYLKDNNLNNYKDVKNNLLNTCFNDFNEDLFNVVYGNSANVVWELEDRDFFNELLLNGWFDNKGVSIKSIEGNSQNDFKVVFNYKSGVVFENISGKFNISRKNFI